MWACYAVPVCSVLVCTAQLYTASLCTAQLYTASLCTAPLYMALLYMLLFSSAAAS